MKRVILTLLTAALLGSVVGDARAIGAYVSWWNLDDANQDGFGGGIRQPIKIVPIFSIDTRIAYVGFSDTDLKVFPLEAVGIVSLGLLYGGLGVGYYFFDSGDDTMDIQNAFGWHVLAGVSLGVRAASVFGEVKWTELDTDIDAVDIDPGSIPTSLDADGVGFNVGVLFGI